MPGEAEPVFLRRTGLPCPDLNKSVLAAGPFFTCVPWLDLAAAAWKREAPVCSISDGMFEKRDDLREIEAAEGKMDAALSGRTGCFRVTAGPTRMQAVPPLAVPRFHESQAGATVEAALPPRCHPGRSAATIRGPGQAARRLPERLGPGSSPGSSRI